MRSPERQPQRQQRPVDDLSITAYDLGAAGGLRIDFDTPVDGVDVDAVAAHQDRFVGFLAGALAAEEPTAREVAGLDVLSGAERELLTGRWAGPVVEADETTLVERFEEQAARFPDKTALIDGDQRVSYAALNADANRWPGTCARAAWAAVTWRASSSSVAPSSSPLCSRS
ncbi:hypothetical protein ACFPN0_31890 [Kitasatospora cinereorecta]